jgi:hypothetical protein
VALLSQTFFLCAVALVPLVFVRITSSIGAAKPSHQSFAIITRCSAPGNSIASSGIAILRQEIRRSLGTGPSPV